MKCADVAAATIKIQKVFRGYQDRKKVEMIKHLPNLKDPEVKQAAVKIQSVYKGFQTRKKLKNDDQEDLPDLKCADVAAATVKIQKVFRGYQVMFQIFSIEGLIF